MSHRTAMSVPVTKKFYPKWDVPLTDEERSGYRGTVCSVTTVDGSRLSEYLDDLLDSLASRQIDPDYILLSKDEIRKLTWQLAYYGESCMHTSTLEQGRPHYINQSTGNLITLAYKQYATLIFLYHPKDKRP